MLRLRTICTIVTRTSVWFIPRSVVTDKKALLQRILFG